MMNLLSVILGMMLVFLVFAIVVSRLREWLAQRTCDRGTFLREGIFRMINDDAVSSRVLQHPLISGLYRDPAERGKPPSYVEPATFALALVNVLVRRGGAARQAEIATQNAAVSAGRAAERKLTLTALRAALENFARQNSPVASALLPIVDSAGDDLDAALKGIEHWYSTGMDRVSGWYKTRARRQLFWIGFALAALVNVDAIQIYRHLNSHPSEAATLADVARQIGKTGKAGDLDFAAMKDRAPTDEEWKQLMAAVKDRDVVGTLPIGYACLGSLDKAVDTMPNANAPSPSSPPRVSSSCKSELAGLMGQTPGEWFIKVLGWLLAAFAGSLGATYWFTALSKVVNIRSSGPPPAKAALKPAAP